MIVARQDLLPGIAFRIENPSRRARYEWVPWEWHHYSTQRPICHPFRRLPDHSAGEFPSTTRRAVIRTRLLDFASPPTTFVGFEAPVAQLDRVYDFGS